MIKIDAQYNFQKLHHAIDKLSPKNMVKALKKTSLSVAEMVKIKEQSTISSYIDRPTPYTKNSMFIKRGKGNSVESTVQFKGSWDSSKSGKMYGSTSSAGSYLLPQVHGGERPLKPFERKLQQMGHMPLDYVAVPTKEIQKNGYGNVPGSVYGAILTDLMLGNARVFGKKGREKIKKKKYFSNIVPSPDFPMGIYMRTQMAMGEAVKPIFLFYPKAHYKRRWPFFEIGKSVCKKNFFKELGRAIDEK